MIEINGNKYSVRDVALALVRSGYLRSVVSRAILILKNRLETVEDKLVEAEKLADELYFAERELQDARKPNVKNE